MADFKGYFTFTNSVNNLLFENVSASSNGGMFGLCIGIAILIFLYEAVKAFRHYLVIVQISRKDDSRVTITENNNTSKHNLFNWFNSSPQKIFIKLKFHCLQTILHMLQLFVGYMIMLVIMSYNAWFLITITIVTAICFYFHEYVLSRKPMILPVEVPNANL